MDQGNAIGVLASEQSCEDTDDFHLDSTQYLKKVFDAKAFSSHEPLASGEFKRAKQNRVSTRRLGEGFVASSWESNQLVR